MNRLSYLFFEVSNRVFIGICQKVQNRMLDVVILEVIHEMCAIPLQRQNK